MTRKHIVILLCAALAGALVGLAGQAVDPNGLMGLLSAPGQGLRELSLSGPWGNLGAWAVTLAITLLPLLLLVLPKDRGPLVLEDWLLPLTGIVGFFMVFFSVNPTLLPLILPEVWPFASLCVYCSLPVAWLVLRVLRRLEEQEADRLAGALRVLLWACALLAADLFTAFLLAQAASLTAVLKEGLFSQEAVERCNITARFCRQTVVWSALLTALKNLLQLTFLAFPLQSDFQVYIPLSSLVLAAALYLLCRCLQQGKELQEDNQSII